MYDANANNNIQVNKKLMESFTEFANTKKHNAITTATKQMAFVISSYDKELKLQHVPYRLRKYLLTAFQSQLLASSLNRVDDPE